MPLAPGSRLGPYQVASPIGAGGMGEVYRARDTRLQRDVALKILPELFAADPDRLARFEREAQLLASLNHPNIGAIYGIEEASTFRALVLELIEGPTLADRITRGALALEEALTIARQIADALVVAHEHGVIHRDLKPANIKVRPDGTVKVLDFGLAKLIAPESNAAASGRSQSPTLTSPAMMTGVGMLLGTAAYMSPEQAKGQEADRRADIWAFGCVLFEMLAGRAAFDGHTTTELLASVLKTEPDWGRLPPGTPEAIRRLLRRCLQKDRKVRLHDAADVRLELDDASSPPDPVALDTQRRLRRRERFAWICALVMFAFTAATMIGWLLARTPSPSEVRLEITTPSTAGPTSVAVSPDGSKIVFAAMFEGQDRLWIRSLDSTAMQPLPGTDRASYPFWSPDSRSIGFFANGWLQRIDVDGGSLKELARANPGRGGSWGRDDVILFAPSNDSEIFRVSAGGGPANAVTRVQRPQQTAHRFPQLLPDGQRFLYYASGNGDARGVFVARLDGSAPTRLFDADAAAVFASSGHILFVRGGILYARPFDTDTLALTGEAFPLAEGVAVDAFTSIAALSASAAGPVVYRSGTLTNRRQFVWFDRAGRELERVGDADGAASGSPAVSSDARHVALTRVMNGNLDVWLFDMARPILSRFTSNPANDVNPVFSPDGTRVVFSSTRGGEGFDLYEKAVTAGLDAEKPIPVTSQNKQNKMATDWSSNGFLLYRTNTQGVLASNYNLWAMAMDGDRKPISVAQESADEKDGQFSPDGKWVAYQSNESGSFEIYLQSFPGQAGKRRVSSNGGAQVRWAPDGRELFYIALDGRLMAVPLQRLPGGQTLEPGTPLPLFVTRVGGAVPNLLVRQQYAVSPDGRFLMHTLVDEAAAPLTVILNWQPRD